MKKRSTALAAVVLLLVGVFTAQPASAAPTGNWQPYPGGFSAPSNWNCGPTSNGPAVSAQACLVRSGNYVQAATIVRNRTSSQVITSVYQVLSFGATSGTCEASGIAANSVSVCFTSTINHASTTRVSADVSGISGFIYSPNG
ncbi:MULTISPECIES: hypothetical protein [unclassified Microbacterium]|uniref:hypothetical protein n=1 Tax=unclassified Microbacterium TaxID=2609290 RepID=UPI000EA8EE1F|nr:MULTISPECIES: hypothetical protein [unclassified Microbacterium]MBT2483374.1 hypothetical protein [Microbacterium sp. ISL-108]RKN66406.1 hypothetical protein D7252_01535 [Microbacterium sp. CGR2]